VYSCIGAQGRGGRLHVLRLGSTTGWKLFTHHFYTKEGQNAASNETVQSNNDARLCCVTELAYLWLLCEGIHQPLFLSVGVPGPPTPSAPYSRAAYTRWPKFGGAEKQRIDLPDAHAHSQSRAVPRSRRVRIKAIAFTKRNLRNVRVAPP